MIEYYKNNKTRITIIAFTTFLIIAYAFFFTSKLTFPPSITGKDSVTKTGEVMDYMTDRTATLLSAVYDKQKRELEVMLVLTNETLDGINDYWFVIDAVGTGVGKVVTDVKMNTNLLTVLRFKNLKPFDELTLFFAPKVKELSQIGDNEQGHFTLNKYNVQEKAINENMTEKDYMVQRLDGEINKYMAQLNKAKSKLETLQTEVKSLYENNDTLTSQMDIMTASEKHDAAIKIEQNKELIIELSDEIASAKEDISALMLKIGDAKQIRDKL